MNGQQTSQYLINKILSLVLRFFNHDIKEKANDENPFFLYIPFHAVHSDVTGRKDLTEKYLNRGLKPRIAEYASMIELLDQNVGKINNALK